MSNNTTTMMEGDGLNPLHMFTFDVGLIGEKVGDRPIQTETDATEVTNWYYSLINGFGFYKDLKFEPVKHGNAYRMRCTFRFVNPEEDEGDLDFHEHLIRDPDDNGNHPIKLNNHKYLVIGTEIEN